MNSVVGAKSAEKSGQKRGKSARTGKQVRGKVPWKRPWLKERGPIASFFLIGEFVHIQCEYSPARVRVIKTHKGARFSGDTKEWRIPAGTYQTLLGTKEFPTTQILNAVPTIRPPLPTIPPPSDALTLLRNDPFSVSEEVLCALPFDVILRIVPSKFRIVAIPGYSSVGKKIIERFTGAVFSGFDGGYTIPAELLGALLKELRSERLLFGIAADAGEALKESAQLRSAIVSGVHRNTTAEDLRTALLVPFVTKVWDEESAGYRFRPCFFTSEQFKAAFPGVRRSAVRPVQRGNKSEEEIQQDSAATVPFTLDETGLLQLVGRRSTISFQVWLTSDCNQVVVEERVRLQAGLRELSGFLRDEVVELVETPVLWRVDSSGGAGLQLATDDLAQTIYSLVSPLLGVVTTPPGRSITLHIPDSKLIAVYSEVKQFFETHDLPGVPETERFRGLLSEIRTRIALRERAAIFTTLGDVPASELTELPLEASSRLFPHQRVAIKWLLMTPCAFLGDDMGLGKTLSVLSYFSALKLHHTFQQLLVICPNSLTRNWLREINQWYPELKGVVVSGDRTEKAWVLRLLTSGTLSADVLILNYEAIRLDYITDEVIRLSQSRRTLLCLDESQRVKNHASKTFKAISEVAPSCERRVLLSGTPTPKDITDLWAQMKLLDGGERFGKNFYRWLESIAELGNEYSDFGIKRFIPEAVQETVLRVQEVMLRRKKERVVNLPEKTFVLREVEMSGAQKKRYDEIRESLVLRMRSTSGEEFVRDITNILEEYLRAVQVSSNPRLIDPEWQGTPAKFLELDEIVNEVVRELDQKIVIWSNYLGNIRELKERYSDLGAEMFSGEVSPEERAGIVKKFQEDDVTKVLIAVPAAGGVGITLTRAQTAVYLDKTWNAEHWMQSVDRIHRIGQTGTVTVISLLASKIDEIIHWNLRKKERAQAEVLGDDGGRIRKVGMPTRDELLKALEE